MEFQKSGSLRLRILYCDDNAEYLRVFRERHSQDFDIEVLSDIGDVYRAVTERRDTELPNVLLLDLYHPSLGDGDGPVEAAARELAEAKLAELRAMLDEVRDCVDRAWSPAAIDVLEALRRKYPAHKLPIMIYTQRGLLLLKDGEIQRIEQADAEWLLKDPSRISGATEALRIRRFAERAKASGSVPRDIKLTLLSVAASTVLGAVFGVVITLLAS